MTFYMGLAIAGRTSETKKKLIRSFLIEFKNK